RPSSSARMSPAKLLVEVLGPAGAATIVDRLVEGRGLYRRKGESASGGRPGRASRRFIEVVGGDGGPLAGFGAPFCMLEHRLPPLLWRTAISRTPEDGTRNVELVVVHALVARRIRLVVDRLRLLTTDRAD